MLRFHHEPAWGRCPGLIALGWSMALSAASAAEPNNLLARAVATAREEVAAGRIDQALSTLRETQTWLRETPGLDPKDRRDGELRLQTEMIKAVREEERRAEDLDRAARQHARQDQRDQAVERLAPEHAAVAHLDRMFFQLGGPGLGGAAGGGGGGGAFAGGGAVGFAPGIGVVPEGITMHAFAVATADRRYVRLSVRPFFVGPVEFFSIPVFGAVSGGGSFGGNP